LDARTRDVLGFHENSVFPLVASTTSAPE
jgi:hypothetical protein